MSYESKRDGGSVPENAGILDSASMAFVPSEAMSVTDELTDVLQLYLTDWT